MFRLNYMCTTSVRTEFDRIDLLPVYSGIRI